MRDRPIQEVTYPSQAGEELMTLCAASRDCPVSEGARSNFELAQERPAGATWSRPHDHGWHFPSPGSEGRLLRCLSDACA